MKAKASSTSSTITYARTGRASIVESRTDGLEPSLRTLMRENGVDDRPFWMTETAGAPRTATSRDTTTDPPNASRRDLGLRLFFFHYWDGPGQETEASAS
jgi:hypothetical protein